MIRCFSLPGGCSCTILAFQRFRHLRNATVTYFSFSHAHRASLGNLLWVRTNKVRGAWRSTGDQSLHLSLSERRNARNAGYFRSPPPPSSPPTPPRPLCIALLSGRSSQPQQHKMAVDVHLPLSKKATSQYGVWAPLGKLIPGLCLRAGGPGSADCGLVAACSCDSVNVNLPLNPTLAKPKCLMHTNELLEEITGRFVCVLISPFSEPPPLPGVSRNVQSHQRLRWYACKWQ